MAQINFIITGSPGPRFPGSLGLRVQGPRFPGSQGPKVPGSQGPRVPGARAHGPNGPTGQGPTGPTGPTREVWKGIWAEMGPDATKSGEIGSSKVRPDPRSHF